MSEEPPRQFCCKYWDRAHEDGTDNEGYGALVQYNYDVEEKTYSSPIIGDTWDFPPVKFCPWCGAKKK